MKGNFCIVLLGLLTTPATAQVQSVSANGDSQRQVIDYDPQQIVQLRGALGYQLMVELSPDEQVKSVALGDSDAWQVDVSKTGDRLFLKPTRADERTNMTVVTSIRTYSFDLEAIPEAIVEMPYTIAFRYPSPRPQLPDPQYVDVSAAIRRASEYRISGDRSIRPESVSDDGKHTYIVWPKNAPIPAIYRVDRSGDEVLVDGMMGTDDVYVVDSVPLELQFRIDRTVARATRIHRPKSR